MENKTTYNIDDIIFVKIKGYPHWPAKITQIEAKLNNKHKKYHVIFLVLQKLQ